MASDPTVTPTAAPPITVGELVDVPAPNSPVNAQYHQEVANRIVHRFPTVAAMNGWAAADGSLAYAAEIRTYHQRINGVWRSFGPVDNAWISYAPTIAGGWGYAVSSAVFQRVGASCTVVAAINLGQVAPAYVLNLSLPFAAAPLGADVWEFATVLTYVTGQLAPVLSRVTSGAVRAEFYPLGTVNVLNNNGVQNDVPLPGSPASFATKFTYPIAGS